MPKTSTPRAPKGTPTSLNIWSLGCVANGRREFSNRYESTAASAMRRCFKAGLVELTQGSAMLRLTDAGVEAVNAEAARVGSGKCIRIAEAA